MLNPNLNLCRADTQTNDDGFEIPPICWGAGNPAAVDSTWLWQGILRAGAITLLTGPRQAGKTTLASVLLARLGSGGRLAGLPVSAGRAVVVTDLDAALLPIETLGIGAHVGWCCGPFRGRPSLKAWRSLVAHLAELHKCNPFSLVVIDPLHALMPGCEDRAGALLDALVPLQRLTARDVSVLVLHDVTRVERVIHQAARGRGALPGHVDILIEMGYCHASHAGDRRRRLWGISRYAESPTRLVIEWSRDGTDYTSLGTFEEEQFGCLWQRLRAVCAEAPHKLTRQEIHARWQSPGKLDRTTLKRWLEQAVAGGLLRRDGKGLRNHPYRYWLPEKENQWRRDAWALRLMPELAVKKDEGHGESTRRT